MKKSSSISPEMLLAFEEIAKKLMSSKNPNSSEKTEKPPTSRTSAPEKSHRSKGSSPRPVKAAARDASPEAGPSGLPNLNLDVSSDEGEFFGDDDDDDPVDSVGFVSDFTDEEDDPSEERLGVSASAFRGRWFTDKLSGERFLPIFLASGYRVDYFDTDQTIQVSNHRYDVDDLLGLTRCPFATKLMSDFASEFSILNDTEFASFIRGAGRMSLRKLVRTHGQMNPSKGASTTPASTP